MSFFSLSVSIVIKCFFSNIHLFVIQTKIHLNAYDVDSMIFFPLLYLSIIIYLSKKKKIHSANYYKQEQNKFR